MIKYVFVLIGALNLIACKTASDKKESCITATTFFQDSAVRSIKMTCKEMNMEKEVIFNSPNDTSNVIIQTSNLRFLIHYFNNVPQGVLIQNNKAKDSLLSHYTKDNKGVYITMNPQSGAVNSIGYKYLRNDEGSDLLLDDKGNVEQLATWQQYSNNGRVYDITQMDEGQIKVYIYKDGEKVDSILYTKK